MFFPSSHLRDRFSASVTFLEREYRRRFAQSQAIKNTQLVEPQQTTIIVVTRWPIVYGRMYVTYTVDVSVFLAAMWNDREYGDTPLLNRIGKLAYRKQCNCVNISWNRGEGIYFARVNRIHGKSMHWRYLFAGIYTEY